MLYTMRAIMFMTGIVILMHQLGENLIALFALFFLAMLIGIDAIYRMEFYHD